jgi:hypothetical protein
MINEISAIMFTVTFSQFNIINSNNTSNLNFSTSTILSLLLTIVKFYYVDIPHALSKKIVAHKST